MRRTTSLRRTAAAGAVAVLASSAPAAAFQFENGTIWPVAVGINGGPAQLVPPEEVGFLFRGQCPTGCQLNVSIADPARAATPIGVAGNQPAAIYGNGDQVTVRIRQERGGITLEVVGDIAAVGGLPQTLPAGAQQLQPLQPLPGSQPLQSVPGQTTVPSLTAPSDTGAPAAPAASQPASPGFVPPPPPPEYTQ